MDKAEPTSVYRYYDSSGILLYVGITKRGAKRNAEHFSKAWWKYVTRQEVDHYPDRGAALAQEAKLITSFQPPFNTQLNPNSDLARSMYLEFAERRESTGIAPSSHFGKKWYDCEIVDLRAKMIRLVVDDPIASLALPGDNVNVPGRTAVLAQCVSTQGQLHLLVTRRNGEFPERIFDPRVKMAIPPQGMTIKCLHWSGRQVA